MTRTPSTLAALFIGLLTALAAPAAFAADDESDVRALGANLEHYDYPWPVERHALEAPQGEVSMASVPSGLRRLTMSVNSTGFEFFIDLVPMGWRSVQSRYISGWQHVFSVGNLLGSPPPEPSRSAMWRPISPEWWWAPSWGF